ncbi:COMM domain-containing protein 4 isoform X2 [Ursus americanus]|uniref:COMM domain-containing protein 4 isoform X2 n=1 Tax=Ursus americanus TaxID=9643 RepID=UPI001E67D767|nr:COMM domain-containing protein 4 isoform X2 [Ursus americanus]
MPPRASGRRRGWWRQPRPVGRHLGAVVRAERLRAWSPGASSAGRKGPHPSGQEVELARSGRASRPSSTPDDLPERFRFCGDLDCPDWVLAEISTLAKIYEKILKLTADARFESGDVKATVAVLSFILSSAAKHSVDGESLSSELQQLGLPKEHAASLCRCYEEKQSPLQEHLRACSLRVNRLAGVGWRVDYTLNSSLLRSVEEPVVHLRLEVAAASGAPVQPVAMSLSADKFQVLLAELKQAQTLMSSLG